jgi:hypothetical protein
MAIPTTGDVERPRKRPLHHPIEPPMTLNSRSFAMVKYHKHFSYSGLKTYAIILYSQALDGLSMSRIQSRVHKVFIRILRVLMQNDEMVGHLEALIASLTTTLR